MKKFQWLYLIALNLLVVLCIFLPFIPGRYDQLSLGLSAVAQVTGFIGLVLVPIGALWLIPELKKLKGGIIKVNNWNNGYYYAVIATGFCSVACLILLLGLLINAGPSSAAIALCLIAVGLYKAIQAIRNLKHMTKKTFNPAPLYLLSIPVLAFTVRWFFIEPASNYSRDYAIQRGEIVIDAFENYYMLKNHYPESIDYLYDIPKPSVMGISEFKYERNDSAYNLSFVQWVHVFATKEIVMYNKNDEQNVKGHFASYNASQPHWKYYWLD